MTDRNLLTVFYVRIIVYMVYLCDSYRRHCYEIPKKEWFRMDYVSFKVQTKLLGN